MSGRARLRVFLAANVGKVVTAQQLRDAAGIVDYARRIRELRDEGMLIRSHMDIPSLRPGEYILESLEQQPARVRGMPTELRTRVLQRSRYSCELCGAAAGDPFPENPARRVRLEVEYVEPLGWGGATDESNMRVVCTACKGGHAGRPRRSESALDLLARVRAAPRIVQAEVYEALRRSFG